jgi:uncharacterized protein
MEPEMTPLLPGERFCFDCSPRVPCFNECCRDLNQFLTPYDILRLKNGLGLTSGEFLALYTVSHIGPETGLPVTSLKQDQSADLKCPFVQPTGCAVYADRPASCRMYPLARALSRSRKTGVLTEYFALLKEPHCQGFADGEDLSAEDWITRQGLKEYNALNDRLMTLISLKNRLLPGALKPHLAEQFHLALYDLDRFRQVILEQDLLAGLTVKAEILEKIRTDDVELLKLGLKWVRFKLFGNAE